DADLKLHYRETIEITLIASLLIHLAIFHLLPSFDKGAAIAESKAIEIQVEDIPQTEQIRNMAAPPPRPAVPIPTENEEIPDDATIESTDLTLDLTALPPPPPPGENDIENNYVFVAYDEPPSVIGGVAAIQQNLVYPQIARKAGIEATVVVGVLVDEHGKSMKTQILKGTGTTLGFEDAAQAAIMAVKWKPAKQRDRAIKVWVSIPIRFKLRDVESAKPIS
ncbi:MAG TPA: energy transducer TonB, partial [bacterium]